MPKFDFGDGRGPVLAHKHINQDGSEGGWVAATATVAPTVYMSKHSRVYGKADVSEEANVSGEAQVYGQAQVFGSALLYGKARVYGQARVYGSTAVDGQARVYGQAEVYGHTRVYGLAQVSGEAQVSGQAWVFGYAQVSGYAQVEGFARVYGLARVYGNARVRGDAIISGDMEVSTDISVKRTKGASDKDTLEMWVEGEPFSDGQDLIIEVSATSEGIAKLKKLYVKMVKAGDWHHADIFFRRYKNGKTADVTDEVLSLMKKVR